MAIETHGTVYMWWLFNSETVELIDRAVEQMHKFTNNWKTFFLKSFWLKVSKGKKTLMNSYTLIVQYQIKA